MKKPKGKRHGIETMEFLEDLANALQAETLELTINYLRLHRFCWMLLRSVNGNCRTELLENYGGGYLEKENQLPFVVGYIFMTATKTSRVAHLLLPKLRDGEESVQLLTAAAKAFEVMLDTGAGAMECMMLETFAGMQLDFSALDADNDDAERDHSIREGIHCPSRPTQFFC